MKYYIQCFADRMNHSPWMHGRGKASERRCSRITGQQRRETRIPIRKKNPKSRKCKVQRSNRTCCPSKTQRKRKLCRRGEGFQSGRRKWKSGVRGQYGQPCQTWFHDPYIKLRGKFLLAQDLWTTLTLPWGAHQAPSPWPTNSVCQDTADSCAGFYTREWASL